MKLVAILFVLVIIFYLFAGCTATNIPEDTTLSEPDITPTSGQDITSPTKPNISPAEPIVPQMPTEPDTSTAVNQNDVLQKQLIRYLTMLFDEVFSPYYRKLHYEIISYEETVDDSSYTSTFIWMMYHLGNGLDLPGDYDIMQWGCFDLQATATINADGILDTTTITLLADDSSSVPLTYHVPLALFFPPPPAIPPISLELVVEYVNTYLQLISDSDVLEIARFLFTDVESSDDHIEAAHQVIEYYEQYFAKGWIIEHTYYFETEKGKQFFVLIRDGLGSMHRVNVLYIDNSLRIELP